MDLENLKKDTNIKNTYQRERVRKAHPGAHGADPKETSAWKQD
jgi:hypothetical protein